MLTRAVRVYKKGTSLMKFIRILALVLCLLLLPFSVFATEVPGAPELTVTQLAGRFALSWSVPNNGGSAIEKYLISYHASNNSEVKFEDTVYAPSTEYTTPSLDTYGTEYTFRIKAVNELGESRETVVYKTLLHQNHIEVARVRDRVEQASFSATLQEATTPEALKRFLERQIAEISAEVSATINISSFEAAQLTQVGSFQFTVSLSLGMPGENTYASTVTSPLKGVISSSGKLSTPKITIATSEAGGLAYQITNTGTAAQAEVIQSYKISIYDTLNDQAVVTDYNVNAAEKSGIINLSAGLKGEATYRATVKACSADSMKYLDSEPSELSGAARAGRIPLTIRPNVTQKYYGDTEPIFGYEIVKGPNPLPTGVELRLTLNRAEGTDVGTYGFSFQQTDANYLVTLEETLFEILPRPITIRPADREVIYEEGATFLLQELGEVQGLLAGDVITALEFNPADARGAVGEFEISAMRAVITSGGKDVTKNYDITYLAGKLIVHPVGYTPEMQRNDGGMLWMIIIIAAAVLLLILGVVLFFVLRARSADYEEEYEEDLPEEEGEESALPDNTQDYEEYLEILGEETVQAEPETEPETEAQEEIAPVSLPQETIEEIENAQAKTENEE